MPRRHLSDSTPPIIDTRKAAIVGISLLIVSVIALLMGSGVCFLFFVLVSIGIIFLGIGNEIMHRVAVVLFGIALVLLGIGLAQVFHL